MGAAAARALARRGRRVVALERFGVGHVHGSSHGPSRIFRFSYHDPEYVRMAMAALDLWRGLESERGRGLLLPTGGLDLGRMASSHAKALEAVGAACQILSAPEVLERFGVSITGDALYQPDAATVSAEEAWRALAASAAAAGAELRENARVTRIAQSEGTAAVSGSGSDQLFAPVVVVTAGAWARELLTPAGVALDVRPTRETVSYFRVPDPGRAPAVVDWDAPAIYALRNGDLVKAGEHQAGPQIDPDEEGSPDLRSVERVGSWIRRRFPGADGRPVSSETCLYTNTDDGHFVLERHERVVVGSPCSGHGFKFAPLIGERLADLAEEVI